MSGYESDSAEGYEDPRRGAPGRTLPAAAIPAKLDNLEKHLAHLGEQVERAEEKLGAALRPERPHPVAGEIGSADRPDESDLAIRLDSMGSRLSSLRHRLSELLDRVDL